MFSANSSQVSDDKLFVEDVFSTYLYTGNGGTQTITNGIDLAGKGGLVWNKGRSAAGPHDLFDTVRGQGMLRTNTTDAAIGSGTNYITYNSNGFSFPLGYPNENAVNYASWTFREAPKFFDVVTYTGNGANRNIAHSLGVAPGCIIVKRTDAAANWQVYHRSNANTEYMVLNTTAAKATGTTRWNSTTPTATEFTVGTDTTVNASGGTYVAYLFAHDATSDGIIQCGSFTTDASGNATVNLGWEPQWVLYKSSSSLTNWYVQDNMRGLGANALVANSAVLFANAASAEGTGYNGAINSTGFSLSSFGASATMVYVAIRRGPMKTPTLGTSVFAPTKQTSTGYTQITGINFAPDFVFQKAPSDGGDGWNAVDKLRGPSASLAFNTIGAEVVDTQFFLGGFLNSGVKMGTASNGQFNGYNPNSLLFFQRAPGFFDEVCYTGTGVARTVNHNLGVAPELMIVKGRNTASPEKWTVYAAPLGNTQYLVLNASDAATTGSDYWDNTSPTSTVFSVAGYGNLNASGRNYVAYLFASCPGVSKVTNFTGTGALQTINCGFASGARFVLIKRTDAAGDWYIYDSSRGISSANDPYLLLNSTAAEVTSTNWVDTDASGFKLTAAAGNNVNINGASYIALAIS